MTFDEFSNVMSIFY